MAPADQPRNPLVTWLSALRGCRSTESVETARLQDFSAAQIRAIMRETVRQWIVARRRAVATGPEMTLSTMSNIRTPIRMRLPIPDRDKIDLGLPVCTLDVNQVAIRPTYHLRPELRGLTSLEYNYFERRTIELCVTPETAIEIGGGASTSAIGSLAYQRISKSELFKTRPASTVLDLSVEDADELWSDVRESLWPGVSTGSMRRNQEADVTQLFFHIVCSSMVANAAFVTLDGNFLDRASELRARYGITVGSPNHVWDTFAPRYSLISPTELDVDRLLGQQQTFFQTLRST